MSQLALQLATNGAAGPSPARTSTPAQTGTPDSPMQTAAPMLHGLVTNVEGAWPAVLDDLLSRVLHCCYGDTWAVRLGGLAALDMLGHRHASNCYLMLSLALMLCSLELPLTAFLNAETCSSNLSTCP